MHVVTDKYGRTFVFRDYVMIARAIDVQKKKEQKKRKNLAMINPCGELRNMSRVFRNRFSSALARYVVCDYWSEARGK